MEESIRCINCSHAARWCDSKPMEMTDGTLEEHDCAQITCDHCGMQFDLQSDEAHSAETTEAGKDVMRKSYHGIS